MNSPSENACCHQKKSLEDLTIKIRWLITALVIAICFQTTVSAEMHGLSQTKQVPAKVSAQIVAIKDNLVTIRNAHGAAKTLELQSAKGLSVGMRTGWCEEDCGYIDISGKKYQVMRVKSAR